MVHTIADSALMEFFKRNSEMTRDEKERETERKKIAPGDRCEMCGGRVVETETNKTAGGADVDPMLKSPTDSRA